MGLLKDTRIKSLILIWNYNLNQYFTKYSIKLEGIFNVKPLQQWTALKTLPLIVDWIVSLTLKDVGTGNRSLTVLSGLDGLTAYLFPPLNLCIL